MNSPNPISYESPGVRTERRRYRDRCYWFVAGQLLIAFVVIVVSVILGAVGGGLTGKAIATWFPSYYPNAFRVSSTQPGFDAVQVGIGTGASQGAQVGVVAGLAIALAVAIFNWRRLRPQV